MQLGGCAWVRSLWPWGGEREVPVTPPSSGEPAGAPEPNDAPAPAPRPAPSPVVVPAAPATRPVVVPAEPETPILPVRPARAAGEPLNLTDLLYPRPAAPATRPAGPPSTRPAVTVARVGPAPTTRAAPIVPRAAEPNDVSIARSDIASGPRPKLVGPDEIVAASAVQVNRHFITVEDVLRKIQARLKGLPKRIAEPAFQQRVAPWVSDEINRQAVRLLVLDEAEKRLTDEQKKTIDVEVKQIETELITDAGGSREALKRKLTKQGTTLQQVLTDYRQDVAFRFYLRGRFMPAITLTRRMLWNYYRDHPKEFAAAKEVQMQLIAAPIKSFLPEGVVRPSAAEREAALVKARALIARASAELAGGKDFGEVAKARSRGIKAGGGGVWPMMQAGTFRESKVEEAAFRLEEGRTSGPIETDTGVYLVRAKRVKPGRVVGFEEAQEQIGAKIRDDRYIELTEEYFKKLMTGATIVQSRRFMVLALTKAWERHQQP